MSRASVTILVMLAVSLAGSALLPAAASALPRGYGKGGDYCWQQGNRPSRYSFEGVYACATTASFGPTTFDSAGRYSFQCVELSARFLWAIYGIWAGPGTGVQDGADLVWVVHGRNPQIRVGSPGPGRVPVAGDVVSLGPGGAVDPRFGHTAIVIWANRRTGYFKVIGQNFPPGHAGEQTLKVDLHGHHNGRARIDRAWTKASWLELRRRRRRR